MTGRERYLPPSASVAQIVRLRIFAPPFSPVHVDAAEAERLGLVDQVFPRAAFEEGWRGIARSLTHRAAGDIKKVMGGVSAEEAIAAFARLWVSDEHWAAADKVMSRAK